jgi:hypothetical protein
MTELQSRVIAVLRQRAEINIRFAQSVTDGSRDLYQDIANTYFDAIAILIDVYKGGKTC